MRTPPPPPPRPKPLPDIVCHYVNTALGVRCDIRIPNTKANRERALKCMPGMTADMLHGTTFTSDWAPRS